MANAISTAQPKEVTREQIAQWELKYPDLKAINDATLDKPRGFTITKTGMMQLVGNDEDRLVKILPRWKTCVLWVLGITVEYEHSIKGYRFIETERHLTNRQSRIMRSAEKKHRMEALRLRVIRDGDLSSDHERSLRLLLANQHSDTAGKINSQREAARIAIAQPETMPRLPSQ